MSVRHLKRDAKGPDINLELKREVKVSDKTGSCQDTDVI